ncbi:hypothetical protein BJX99DRAFT_263859 [Aspergillus californicus]
MPISWNAEAEAKLLLGVLDQLPGAKLDYKALAQFMGPDCSVPAVKQHVQKLRRTSGTSGSASQENAAGKVQPSPASTPKKTKRAQSPATPMKRRNALIVRPHYDAESSEEETKEADEGKKLSSL